MKLLPASAVVGVLAGATFISSPALLAQQSPSAPASPPAEAIPAIGPADPNLRVVQLPNGNLINPGLVAAFYTHGYPQSYIDGLIAQAVNNT